jgi:hypothetical protein
MADGNGRPGTFRLMGSLFRAPLERAWERELESRHTALAYEAANSSLEQVVRRVRPDDDEFTIPAGELERELTPELQEALRTRARRAALLAPLIVGYLRNLEQFVMGEGPKILAATDDEAVNDAIDEWWAKFMRWNDWALVEDEIPRRMWVDGEAFVRRFESPPRPDLSSQTIRRLQELGVTRPPTPGEKAPEGMIFIRLIAPEHVADPKSKITHGILTAEHDVRTVLGYVLSTDGREAEFVPAEDIEHVKIRADSDVKRGRSLFEPLLQRNAQYEDWLDHRILLNKVRSAIALVKKIEGSGQQVTALRDAQATTDRPRLEGDERRLKALRGGTTITAGKGIDYQFLSPNLQATDAQKDGRSIILNMAAAATMPEFMFTADANSMNFATSLVAEGPAVRQFQSWREILEGPFGRVWSWAVVSGAAANQIKGLSEDKARELRPSFDWPEVQVREELQHTQANQIRHLGGIISKEGWARDEGIDWDAEQERIAGEREAAVEFTAPFVLPGDDEDEEGEAEEA